MRLFNKETLKCPNCGNETFYPQELVMVEKDINNTQIDKNSSYSRTVIKHLLKCSKCSSIINDPIYNGGKK